MGAEEVKRKRRRIAPAPFAFVSPSTGLDQLEVHGLRATLIGFDFEANALAFIEAAKTRRLNSSDMDEHVLAAAFRCDESETLCRVEELYLTDSHTGFLLKALSAAANDMSVTG
jgi:hypothetical protein